MSTAANVARSVAKDGLCSEALDAFISCGAYGAYENNQERDLLLWLRGVWGFHLEPYPLKVPLGVSRLQVCKEELKSKDKQTTLAVAKVGEAKLADIWVLLPHEVLHAIYAVDPSQAWFKRTQTLSRICLNFHIILEASLPLSFKLCWLGTTAAAASWNSGISSEP